MTAPGMPDDLDLLAVALQALADLAERAALSASDRRDLAIVANLVGVAWRGLADGGRNEEAEQRDLAELLSRSGDIAELRRELARQIRAGEWAVGDARLVRYARAAVERELALLDSPLLRRGGEATELPRRDP